MINPCRGQLFQLREEWSNCDRCDLHKTRTNVVFGEGNPDADILIVGEGPGATEDTTGSPFQGDAGEVLNQFLKGFAIDRRKDVFITNVVGCRPTQNTTDERTGKAKVENRPPSRTERESCRPRLLETIYLVDPMVIVAVGKVPYQALTGKGAQITAVRGRFETIHIPGRHTDIRYAVMPMFHTAFLLRTQDKRKEGPWGKTWRDWALICSVIDNLRVAYCGTPIPDRVGSDDDDGEAKRSTKGRGKVRGGR